MAPVRRLVVLAFLAAVACGGGDLTLPGGVTPSALRIVTGNEQSGSVGDPLSLPVVVEAIDAEGHGISGIRIAFEPSLGGVADPETAVTDLNGEATTSWKLGTTAGEQGLAARVDGSSDADLAVAFTAAASAGAPHTLAALSGADQSAAVGTALPDSLVVEATDQFGNPVAGVEVDWTASAGSIAPVTVQTGADGRAGARRVLGSVAGPQTATAESPGLEGSPITFNHSALPGAAASLVLVSGDQQSGPPGSELPEPLVVRLVDESGNGTPGQPISWVVTPGSGTVDPTSSQTDQDGFASARWTLGNGADRQTLSAVASGVGIVEFEAHAGTGGPGEADHLIFLVQPSTEEEDRPLSPPVEVAVVDLSGSIVSLSDVRIQVELVEHSNRLRGDEENDTQAGVAVFDDLTVDRDGKDYVLRAFAPELPELGSVESEPFEITNR